MIKYELLDAINLLLNVLETATLWLVIGLLRLTLFDMSLN